MLLLWLVLILCHCIYACVCLFVLSVVLNDFLWYNLLMFMSFYLFVVLGISWWCCWNACRILLWGANLFKENYNLKTRFCLYSCVISLILRLVQATPTLCICCLVTCLASYLRGAAQFELGSFFLHHLAPLRFTRSVAVTRLYSSSFIVVVGFDNFLPVPVVNISVFENAYIWRGDITHLLFSFLSKSRCLFTMMRLVLLLIGDHLTFSIVVIMDMLLPGKCGKSKFGGRDRRIRGMNSLSSTSSISTVSCGTGTLIFLASKDALTALYSS